MTALTATGTLVRFLLRRDRLRIPLWIAGITALVAVSTIGVDSEYPTREALEARAELVSGNPAMVAITGPGHGLDEPTLGRVVANDLGGFALVVVALMSIFLVVRHTRAEEEEGRVALVQAGVVGRYADTTASMLVVGATNLAVGGATAATLVALSLPVPGSLAFGAALAMVGIVFAAVAGVASQVATHARSATGLAGALLGLAFALRAVGDIGAPALSWLSPIGWGQAVRPYAGEVLWPLALGAGFALLLLALGLALEGRRDVGAGLIGSRPGPPRASGALRRPIGLALRLQRGALLGWSAGVLAWAAAYGAIGREVETLVEDNPGLLDVLPAGEASITDLYLAMTTSLIVLIATGFGVQSALRLRSEEMARRAGMALSGGLSRTGWMLSFAAVTAGGLALVLAAAGAGQAAAFAIATGETDQVPRLFGAVIAHLPAALVVVGLALALFGLVPRAAAAAWAVLGGAVLAGPFGELLNVPGWLRELSPYEYVGDLPAEPASATSLVALAAIAAALTAVGALALGRRDVSA